MRLLGYILLASFGLALLRLAIALGLVLVTAWLLWALVRHPATTITALILFAAVSIAQAHPALALTLFSMGVLTAYVPKAR
ncbi:hypothetical protein TMRO357_02889 [Alteriqipengyuania sp. 357]